MSPRARVLPLSAAVVFAALLGARPADAQGWLDRAKQRAQDKVRQRIDRKTDQAIDRTLDRGGAAAGGAASGAANAAKPAGAPASAPAPGAAPSAEAEGAGAADALRPGEGAWANYDFTPGDRVLFADDFSRDAVGDFPRRLQLKKGSLEIVEWQGRRFLRASARANTFTVTLPEALPRRFTLEFDYSNESGYGWGGLMVSVDGKDPEYATQEFRFRCNHDNAGVETGQVKAMRKPSGALQKQLYRCRLLVDGDYAKAYVNEQRVANAPGTVGARGRVLHFTVAVFDPEKAPALIGDLRVAAGGRKLYDALAESGRVATQGVYFDVGSERIRPESTPTLKEIARMLDEHPELKLAIEGHTDATGQAAANLALSSRRAAAVREALVTQFGVDAGRLTAKGLGQSKPAAPNATPEGRQQNRRVELVRM